MKNWGEVALGLVTGIGGFLEIGSIATTAQAGAEFGVQLAWVLLVGTVGLALEMATGIGLRWWALAVTFVRWLLLWRDGRVHRRESRDRSAGEFLRRRTGGDGTHLRRHGARAAAHQGRGSQMSRREILLHHLVGRKVRDLRGEVVGRIHELCVEIALHAQGNDYVVREFRIGSLGALEFLGASHFLRELLHTLRIARADAYVVSWDQLDLSDPERPMLLPREA